MNRPTLTGLVLALVALAVPAAAQNPAQPEIISASCLIAFGRPALASELADAGHAGKGLKELVAAHRSRLEGDARLQQEVDARARRDARGPSAGDQPAASRGSGVLYADRLAEETAALAADPAAYRAVMEQAYRQVIGRSIYPEEFDYWKPYGTLPFVVLVGALENWAVRNQPGLMVTNGAPSISVVSRFLVTQRLSPAVANEARELLGLRVWTDVARQHNPGRNIVSRHAVDVDSVGGVHFVFAGGGPLAGR
jgi:hypothetical protein